MRYQGHISREVCHVERCHGFSHGNQGVDGTPVERGRGAGSQQAAPCRPPVCAMIDPNSSLKHQQHHVGCSLGRSTFLPGTHLRRGKAGA